ncbi:MAG TPA: hypothetical protein VFB38_02070 [Chthonomonadaceae bacterium]|nr:hypothetical protein [Chthonomonadaceae bacterium]
MGGRHRALRSIGRPGWPPPDAPRRRLSRREALAAAQFWLRALGFTDRIGSYRLAQEPQQASVSWRLRWRRADPEVELVLSLHTGELIALRAWQRPPAASAPSSLDDQHAKKRPAH